MSVELALARGTARKALVVGPVTVLAAGLLRGLDGALAAGLAVAVVVGNLLASGAMLSVAARISPAAYQGAALLGFVLRLGLIAASFFLIVAVLEADRLVLGVTAVVSYLVLVSWEAVDVSRRDPDPVWGEAA